MINDNDLPNECLQELTSHDTVTSTLPYGPADSTAQLRGLTRKGAISLPHETEQDLTYR